VAGALGEAVLVPGTADGAWARTPVGRLALHAPGSGPGRVLLRPEQVQLHVVEADVAVGSEPATGGTAGTGGRVSEVRFFGHDALVTVAVPDLAGQGVTTVRARLLGAPSHLVPGTAVQLSVSGPVTFFA
jgi:iron(III) transport system ATP-binding protein